MKSQSSLPIQYSAGLRSDISHSFEKTPDSSGVAQLQQEVSRASFPTQLNESIIDVYERSKENTAVPDERTVADRRQASTRRLSSQESTSIQSDKTVTDINMSSTDQKINQTHSKTGKTTSAIFKPSRENDKLVDIWA